VLQAWGKIKGVLLRASQPGANESIDLALDGFPLLSLQLHTMTDAEGRFEIDHVPPGRIQINGRNLISANSWTWEPLEKVTVKPGAETTVNIHAPAKSSKPTR
jgi:hypothetical protein